MLKIQLPKEYYCQGEPVIGTVELETRKNINNLVSIQIRLKGFEHIEWPINGDRNAARGRKRRVFNDQLIKLVDGSLSPILYSGKHSFPFQFVVPDNASSSFSYKENSIRILNYLKASVKIENNRDLVVRHNIRVGSIYMIEPSIPPKIGEVTKSFLFAQNEEPMLLKGQLNKEIAQCGSQLMAYVDINNFSTRTLKEMKVKLKRIVEQDGRKMERQTIRKITFRVLVENGMKWKGRIPIAIPQGLDLNPTIENAQLLSCRYFVSIQLNVFGAKRIKVELPFKVSLFPPFVNGMDANALFPHELPLYQYYPFLQPFSQVDEVPLSSNGSQLPNSLPVSAESTKEPLDLSGIDEAIERTKRVIDDLASFIYYSEMNQMRESTDFDAKMDFESARNELVESSQFLIEWEVSLISSLSTLPNAITNATKISEQLVSVAYLSKQAAAIVPDVSFQIRILNASKGVGIATLRLLLACKNRILGGETEDKMVEESAIGLEESVRNLVDLLTLIEMKTMEKKEEMENIQREIENYLLTFSLPTTFDSSVNGKETEDIKENGKILSNRIQNLMSSAGVSQDKMADAMNGIKSALFSFLEAAKRASSQNGTEIGKEGSEIIEGTKKFMDCVLLSSYSNSFEDQENSMKNANDIIRNVSRLIENLIGIEEKKAPVTSVLPNLNSAIEQVKRAGERLTALAQEKSFILNQEKETSNEIVEESTEPKGNQTILESSSSLTDLTQQLLQLVVECNKNENSNDYEISGTTRNSLERSVETVLSATEQLTSVAHQNPLDPEGIEVASRNMTSAISNFVSTSMVVAPADTREQFSKISKQIAYHASAISAAARALAVENDQQTERESWKKNNFNPQNTQKVEAFENQVKILRLEKELEQTRQDLLKNRKSILQSCPPPIEDK
eukprot:TRINITY_DN3338_c3_g1_i1.p1 TRINITY_DN3338_c3_g1~~TRINITY_DN3338_c3_g1_i1.p1  ORF type:complete len:906 (+),score=386.15 TRINITY_DN3338_c3_g1_i1:88-2805(+)